MTEYRFIYIAKVWGKDLFTEEIHKMVPFEMPNLPKCDRLFDLFLYHS